MKDKRVAIVGCGSVGSRHLQAIAKLHLQCPLKIQVLEPSASARQVGRERLEELALGQNAPDIEWLGEVDDLDRETDLTIVSTTSSGRVELIKQLLPMGHKQFLIEKMVCQSSDEYRDLIDNVESSHARGWIDYPFRYFDFYTLISESLVRSGSMVFHVNAGGLELGCVAIHYLDLFIFLTQLDPAALTLKGVWLQPDLEPSKRSHRFVKFLGTITANTEDHFVSISTLLRTTAPAVLQFSAPNLRFCVDEKFTKAFVSRKENGWNWDMWPYRYQHNSETTMAIAYDLLTQNDCRLPTLQEGRTLHEGLFRIFNSHVESVTGSPSLLCPIT